MRVLQLVNRRQRRGAEIFATELADVLAARGHEVLVAGIYSPRGTLLTPERATFRDLVAAERRFYSRSAAKAVASLIREFRPDVVQANGSDTLKYSVLADSPGRRPWRLVYRNISVASRWLRGPVHRSFNRWLVGRVDHVVAVSRASARDFAETYDLPPDRLTVIPQAVRIPAEVRRNDARRALLELTGAPSDSVLVFHAGSFSPEKNHIWLVDAFRRIRARQPLAHLVLLGDGALRPQVEARVGELGLGGVVHLLGSRDDAAQLMAAADLFVLPSLVEGLPGVILEAAAQGVPSVATDVGGVREVVVDGKTGRVVPPGDMEGFVATVDALLSGPEYRSTLGAGARALARSAYDLESIVSDYETLYAKLLSTRVSA